MGQDDKIHNPVEQYMKYIMDLDKPDKPPETTAEPTKHLEVKMGKDARLRADGGNRYDALKVADAIKQSVNIKMNSQQENPEPVQSVEELRIFDIRRHPVGLVILFLEVITVYATAFSLISFFLPGIARAIGASLGTIGPITGIVMLALCLFGATALFFAARNYLSGRLILTDFNIVHVFRSGLYDRKVSELLLSDIKDVIIQKPSPLSSLFDYGTIIIETPEGQSDFIFTYTPDPEIYAKAVNDSRLEYLANHRIANL